MFAHFAFLLLFPKTPSFTFLRSLVFLHNFSQVTVCLHLFIERSLELCSDLDARRGSVPAQGALPAEDVEVLGVFARDARGFLVGAPPPVDARRAFGSFSLEALNKWNLLLICSAKYQLECF